MTGVVVDTNVLVSANLNDEGFEAFVVYLCLAGRLTLYVSGPILEEYERVLYYPRLKFQPVAVAAVLQRLRKASTLISPTMVVTKAKHEPDNRFLECAEAAAADFLVTGNLRHFPGQWKGTKIVNSRQFLDVTLDELRRQK